MKSVDIGQLALPPGTQGWTDEANVYFTLMWQSATGQHCLIMKVPADLLDLPRFKEGLEAAVGHFISVFALEIISDKIAAIGK